MDCKGVVINAGRNKVVQGEVKVRLVTNYNVWLPIHQVTELFRKDYHITTLFKLINRVLMVP